MGILALDDHPENGIWCTNGRTVFLLQDNELYTTDFQNIRSSFNQLLHTKMNTLIVGEKNAYQYALRESDWILLHEKSITLNLTSILHR